MNKRNLFFYSTLFVIVLFPSAVVFSNNDITCGSNTMSSMACEDFVNISLDEDCSALVTPDQLLSSSISGSYSIDIFYFSLSLSNPLDDSYAYDLLDYTITSDETGNSCSGVLMLLDFISPVIECPTEPVVMNCNTETDTVTVPEINDNCTGAFLIQIDEFWFDTDYCDDGKVKLFKTFTGFDYNGNEAEPCTQVIELIRETEIDFPNDILWSYDQFTNYEGITDTLALNEALYESIGIDTQLVDFTDIQADSILTSTGSGVPRNFYPGLCEYSIASSDVNFTTCANGQVIVRTWMVLDWCTNELITGNTFGEDNIQFIFVSDVIPPLVTGPDSLLLNAENPSGDANLCLTRGFVPPPVVLDDSVEYEIRIFSSIGELDYVNGVDGSEGAFIPFPGLPLGEHIIEYKVKDDCDNETILSVPLSVVDQSNPVLITVPSSLISLNDLGLIDVFAEVFDQGSFDNCCIDYFEIKKETDLCNTASNLNYSESIQFCCEEVGTSVPVKIRVFDCFGNSNEAIISIVVQDNLPPVITSCPSVVSLDCTTYTDDILPFLTAGEESVLNSYGVPSFYDNCTFSYDYELVTNIDDCNQGTIERIWSVKDATGTVSDVCSQIINIDHVENWSVLFQEDLIINCLTDTLGVYQSPIIFNQQCALVSSAFNDVVFDGGINACYSFFREWTCINWCTYNVQDGNFYSDLSEVDLAQDLNSDGKIDSLVFTVSSGPQGNSDGVVQYTQFIRVVDENAPVVEVSDQSFCSDESNCLTQFFLATPNIEDCSSSTTLSIESNIPNGDHLGPYSEVPPGLYSVDYSVTDNCDNTTIKTINVVVEDCSAPLALCRDTTLEITNIDSVTIGALDLAWESVDNCSTELGFTFSASNSETLMFSCQDQGEYIFEIEVNDSSGNNSTCSSIVVVADSAGNCLADDLQITGAIMTENSIYLDSVEVHLEELFLSNLTDDNGNFEFTDLLENDTCTLKPHYETSISLGVTTLDVVKIKLHILQSQLLDSPYKLIAADINNNGTISTIDIVALKKVILGLSEDFPNNSSWRFIPVDYVFEDPANPLETPFPEHINFSPLQASNLESNFYAIKVGDVTNSIDNLGSTQIDNRTENVTYPIIISDQDLVAGQFQILTIQTKLTQLLGLQGRLSFDMGAIEIESCKNPDFLEGCLINTKDLNKGVLTFLWDGVGSNIQNPILNLELAVYVKKDCKLADIISLDKGFVNEAYFDNGVLGSLDLSFNSVLNQSIVGISPNPFSEKFFLRVQTTNEAQDGILRIYDLNGKLIKHEKLEVSSGESLHTIQMEGLKGIYLYDFSMDNFSKKGRIIAL
jgi:hypothetical protein